MGRKPVWPPRVAAFRGRDRVFFSGRYHYLGPAGTPESRANYARLLAAWASDPGAALRPAGELLCVELCAAYMAADACPKGGRPRERVARACRLLAELHLVTPVADFGPVALDQWQGWLCARLDARGGKEFARTYVVMLVRVIRAVWRWGVRTERVAPDRLAALKTVPGPAYGAARETEAVRAAVPADVDATLPHLRGPTRAMVRVQVLTGARPGEVCRMRPRDIARAGKVELPGGVGFVDLDASGVWVYLPEKHKGESRRKPRWVVIGPQAQAVIAPFLAGRPAEKPLFSPAEARAEWAAEMAARRKPGGGGNKKPAARSPRARPGEAYTVGSYASAVGRAARRAGVPHWHPHRLRHLAGANVDFAGGLDDAQAVLGHDSPATTRRYAKRSFAAAARVAREMG